MNILLHTILNIPMYSSEECIELNAIFVANYNTDSDHEDFYAWLFESDKRFLLYTPMY